MAKQEERITLTIRAGDKGSLDALRPFLQPGAHVAIGRGVAVIDSVALVDAPRSSEDKASCE